MPVTRIDKGKLVQECAICGAGHEHSIPDLVLGAEGTPSGAPDTIVLPACSCGAIENLLRTWDEMPVEGRGSRFDRHRRIVNGLAQLLKQRGQSHPDAKAGHDREDQGPPDIDELGGVS